MHPSMGHGGHWAEYGAEFYFCINKVGSCEDNMPQNPNGVLYCCCFFMLCLCSHGYFPARPARKRAECPELALLFQVYSRFLSEMAPNYQYFSAHRARKRAECPELALLFQMYSRFLSEMTPNQRCVCKCVVNS